VTTITAASEPAAQNDDRRPARAPRWPLVCALVLVVAPFVATAVRVLISLHGSLHYAGDQAITGLDTHDAASGSQLVGPYSRYGWAHPGPAWFYLLAPWYQLFGRDDAGLVAASLLVHALMAAAFVAVFWRPTRPAGSLLAAGILLLFVLRMPASVFLDVWNPYALILGTAVLLALAGKARDGRWSSLLLLVIAGSYLVQTHVGTALLVLLVGLVWLAACLSGRRRSRAAAADDALQAARRWPVAVLGGVVVLMWVPPVLQQLTSPLEQGNLGRLVHFFLVDGSGQPGPSLAGAFKAAGRVLIMAPYGWDAGPFEMDLLTLPAAVVLGLVAQTVASVTVLLLGRRWAVPSATWTGPVRLAGRVAAVLSALTVSGTVYWYLLIWVAVLPAVTLLGGCLLFLGDGPARRDIASIVSRGPGLGDLVGRRSVVVGLTVLLVGGAVGSALSLSSAVDRLPNSAGVAAVVPVVEGAVAHADVPTVRVDILTHDRWPIAAGLVEDMEAHGIAVTVGSSMADLFGAARVSNAASGPTVSLVAPDDPLKAEALAAGARELATVETETGAVTILFQTGD